MWTADSTMLSHEETQEIEAEFSNYAQKSAVVIEALKIVQRHRRWVSDESVHDIAALLEMTPDEVDSVASFYNLIFRRPVGQHVILMCDSITCWIMGCERLGEELSARLGIGLGETTADGEFTFLPIVCLGTCDHAPALMVDDDLYRDVEPDRVDDILQRYRRRH
jgi:NADH-quinone oxidoreductase subunit E